MGAISVDVASCAAIVYMAWPSNSCLSILWPQVLTLHVDAPEAWLLECTEAAYDMDNIRLAELGDRRTLSASYELASLLITGELL